MNQLELYIVLVEARTCESPGFCYLFLKITVWMTLLIEYETFSKTCET